MKGGKRRAMSSFLRTVVSMVLLLTSIVIPSLPAQACADSHILLRLAGFPGESDPIARPFYYGIEGSSPTFIVRRISDDCSGSLARAGYAVDSDSAVAGEDYETTQGTTQWLEDSSHGVVSEQEIPVPLGDDPDLESPVENATVRLHSAENATISDPSQAPMYVIDDEGPTRYSFGEAVYQQSETYTIAKIPVFRGGDASGTGSVSYTMAPHGSSPATENSDFEVPANTTVDFPAGDRVVTFTFTIKNDEIGEGPEQLAVQLEGVEASGITTTVVTILDNEEFIAPTSRFHHPRNGYRYRSGDYRIREVHVFTKDNFEGSGVIRTRFALRRKMTSGRCAWWTGSGFTRGGCKHKLWLKMRIYDPGRFFYYRLPPLRRSTGTKVRNYRAFSQAIDGAFNHETRFTTGRNANTFEVY